MDTHIAHRTNTIIYSSSHIMETVIIIFHTNKRYNSNSQRRANKKKKLCIQKHPGYVLSCVSCSKNFEVNVSSLIDINF